MKTLYQFLLLSIGALALAGTAIAQVPSTNDTSDMNENTGMGTRALAGPAAKNNGSGNTAAGFFALASNTTGNANTACGASALQSNTTGSSNTATGVGALLSNTTGTSNTASGASALQSNTTGSSNTAFGQSTLQSNTGDGNTASGNEALSANTSGDDNSAFGMQALSSNTSGHKNTATGTSALTDNTTGTLNTASGFGALEMNTTGNFNTASGFEALPANTTGSDNIAVGFQAALDLTTGSNNIDIGNRGVAADSDTIRIGTAATQKATFIAGIFGTSVTGSAVVVNSNGRLGVTVSSERFKTAIAPMGSNTTKLGLLRPVTFHLKTDPNGALQYGLIAEEVARIYPELVIRNESGRIDGVRYDELAPMLLNEVQKLTAQVENNATQAEEIRDLKQQVAEMRAAPLKLQAKDERLAQR
jgi:hypothetical protein